MSNDKSCENNCELGHTFAMLLLRLWLGVRALQTGLEKFSGYKEQESDAIVDGKPSEYGLKVLTDEKEYGMKHWHGVPSGQADQLQSQPLMPGWAYDLFDSALAPVLIILGITILLGVALRSSLLALGVLFTGLTWGMILMGGPSGAAGVSWLGVHMILIVAALLLIKHNKFGLYKKW